MSTIEFYTTRRHYTRTNIQNYTPKKEEEEEEEEEEEKEEEETPKKI